MNVGIIIPFFQPWLRPICGHHPHQWGLGAGSHLCAGAINIDFTSLSHNKPRPNPHISTQPHQKKKTHWKYPFKIQPQEKPLKKKALASPIFIFSREPEPLSSLATWTSIRTADPHRLFLRYIHHHKKQQHYDHYHCQYFKSLKTEFLSQGWLHFWARRSARRWSLSWCTFDTICWCDMTIYQQSASSSSIFISYS